jgi:hypothetical protein
VKPPAVGWISAMYVPVGTGHAARQSTEINTRRMERRYGVVVVVTRSGLDTASGTCEQPAR